MSQILVKAWHCDRKGCGYTWYTGKDTPPKRCAFCKSPNWNRLEAPERDGTEIAPTVSDSPISDNTESAEELDATAPEVQGRGKATLTKVVKRKPEQPSQPCRHGLFYHPNCNG